VAKLCSKRVFLRALEDGKDEEPALPSEPKRKQLSFVEADGKLYEQVFTEKGHFFLEYDPPTDSTRLCREVKLGGEIIEPVDGDDVERGAVKLPTETAEYASTSVLLKQLREHIHRFLDVPESYLRFASYYVLLSWVYDRFRTVPYLRALGDTGTGKSRFLDVIGGLCYKPISASGCVTPAPIYRMLRRWGGTVILDEADFRDSDEYNEVVTILNCGFERGRPVIRALKDNPDRIQILPAFGPKVFATRRRFKDVALEARCLTQIMRETSRPIPAVLGREFFLEQEDLRNQLLLFRFRNYFSIDPEAGLQIDLPDVEPRLKQVSSSFLALFANDPEVLEDYKEFIKHHQRELIEQRAATTEGRVIIALFGALSPVTVETIETVETAEEKPLPISAGDLAEKLSMRPQVVGQILHGLGIETKPVKVRGQTKRCILFNSRRFKVLRRRYILDETSDEKAQDETCDEKIQDKGSDEITSLKTSQRKNSDFNELDVCDVSDVKSRPLPDDDTEDEVPTSSSAGRVATVASVSIVTGDRGGFAPHSKGSGGGVPDDADPGYSQALLQDEPPPEASDGGSTDVPRRTCGECQHLEVRDSFAYCGFWGVLRAPAQIACSHFREGLPPEPLSDGSPAAGSGEKIGREVFL